MAEAHTTLIFTATQRDAEGGVSVTGMCEHGSMPGQLFKARLKDGFREPLRHGRFVGRERELGLLTELFAERRAATVLLAGFRGAGKTALVNEALQRAERSEKQLVVRVTPPFLAGLEAPREQIRAQVLRSLARGLYFAVIEHGGLKGDLRKKIEATYEKTYLTELQTHELIESVASADIRRAGTTSVRAVFEGSAASRFLAGAAAVGITGAAGIGAASFVADAHGALWGVTAFLFVALGAVASGLRLERRTSTEESLSSQLGEKDSRTRVGKLDLSEDTLEFELRQALGDVTKDGFRVIFVLDELDKLEQSNESEAAGVEATPVFRIVASLKNFFSLGRAVYIFITDDAFFEKLALTQQGTDYSLSHTIFTDRFFVGPLHYSEVEELIDRSLDAVPEEDAYDRFKNFVCWESSNHVFDALQILSSYVELADGAPLLAPSESGVVGDIWKEGSLPIDWLTRAALQKHVGVALDEARRSGPGEALYNQALWESLQLTARMLLEAEEISVTDAGVTSLPGRFIGGLSSPDRSGVSSAVERMLIRLERHAAVDGDCCTIR